MENIFFDINFTSFEQMLLKVFTFILVSGILLFLIYFVLAKFLFNKNNYRREVKLRLAFLWALLVFFILFNVYIFVLFYKNGIDSFNWTIPNFYLGIFAQLSIYIGIFIYFFIKSYSLKKIIKDNSIN